LVPGEPGTLERQPGALPAQRARLKKGHHAAMAFSDLPDFIVELRKRTAPAARALELTILLRDQDQ